MGHIGTQHDEERSGRIGDKVRQWRQRLGLRQGDLAKKTGMSAAQLCHIEKDRNVPSVRTLHRIAEALGVPFAELAAAERALPGLPDGEPLSTRWSLAPPMCAEAPSPNDYGDRMPGSFEGADGGASAMESPASPPPPAAIVAMLRPVAATSLADLPSASRLQVRKRIQEYAMLEKRTGVPTRPSLPLDYPAEVETEDAEALARAVRRDAGIADAVLFDTIELLEAKGLRVVAADLPEKLDAFALWDDEARNVWLMIRKNATDERQQFRAACTFADVLRFVSEGAREPVEDTPWNRRFAREFASAFLMPEGALRERCFHLGLDEESWTWELLLREKLRFGVSAEAFAYRLENLGLLRPSLRQDFVRRAHDWYEAHGFTEPNPSSRKALRHSRFSDLKMLVR